VRTPGWSTVIMVCDPPNFIEHFDHVFELLSPHGRVVVFEPPGFGFSCPKRGFRFTFDDYLAAIEGLLRTLDEGPYVLAFTCVWGHIALQIAAKHPEMVAKLMLWQCPAWEQQARWARNIDKKRVLLRPVLGQLTTAWASEKIGVNWYRAAMAKGRHTDFAPTLRDGLGHGGFHCMSSLWQQWFTGFTPPEVHVEQPTLVTWGAADRTHAGSGSDPRSIATHLTQIKWHSFANAGHSPELESSQEYAELLRDWIATGAT
jgi:pimeloyl-ACP methyl ester carboxylesterase